MDWTIFVQLVICFVLLVLGAVLVLSFIQSWQQEASKRRINEWERTHLRD
jgi:Tfp pilus assembly protein PilO